MSCLNTSLSKSLCTHASTHTMNVRVDEMSQSRMAKGKKISEMLGFNKCNCKELLKTFVLILS